jgi:polyphenol oxidase
MLDTRLPQPNDSFRWVQAGRFPALVCKALEPIARHAITTRDWPLGSRPDVDESDAWADVANAMAVPAGSLQRVRQVHGADVLVLRAGEARSTEQRPTADVIVSADPAVAIVIQTADCVPLLIADRQTGAVAAAHAGWRGLAAGVPRATLGALAREFGSRTGDLTAAVGPSIGACCYEVGPDVRQRFAQAGWPESMINAWFFVRPQPSARNPSMRGLAPPRPDRWYFDAALAARDQLESAGVPEAQIFVAELCTASHPDIFCSYRRDGRGAGRIAGTIRANSRLQFAERGE